MTRSTSDRPGASAGASAPMRTVTLSERVLQELRSRLAQGRFAPGDRIGVDALAAEFEISPLPVREALRVLLAEGHVEYSAHRGYRIATLTLADVEEMFLMCRLLEGEALRRSVPRLDDAAIARMRELLAQLESMAPGASAWDQAIVHQDFHFVPMEQAGLPRMQAELRRLWGHTDHYRALYFFRDEVARAALQQEHHELVAACEQRDAERVVELMNQHRDHAIEWMARGFAAEDASGEESG